MESFFHSYTGNSFHTQKSSVYADIWRNAFEISFLIFRNQIVSDLDLSPLEWAMLTVGLLLSEDLAIFLL